MKLIDKEVIIGDIMLDPINPRFLDCFSYKQNDILNSLLGKKSNRELANSMKEGIKWINKIVVREIDNLSNDKKEKFSDVNNYVYITVEGNNRLACLKSGEIYNNNEKVTEYTKIPVLVAIKEEGESDEHFEMEIKIIQGISNVMVVKEWEPVPKAKHIFNIYETKKEMNPTLKMSQITSQIGYELGIDNAKVRDNIIRYSIFKEVNKLSDEIPEDDWGFLEAFDQNPNTRGLFGMCKNTIEFEWDKNDEGCTDIDEKQELLMLIPEIIRTAKKEYPNSKKFRDDFKKIINKYDDFHEVKDTINLIINPNESANWSSISEDLENYTSEQKTKNELTDIYKRLNSISVGADWAINLKQELINIYNKVEKYLKIIES